MTNETSNNRNVIRLGWHLHPNDVAVDLPLTNDIAQHTAFLAQSGSGKSFFLGRFLEELLLATKSKIVIFDINGDFSDFNKGNKKSWEKDSIRKWFGEKTILKRDLSFVTFLDYWEKISFEKINKDNPSLVLFSSFPMPDMFKILGLSETNTPEQIKQLSQELRALKLEKIEYSLNDLIEHLTKKLLEEDDDSSTYKILDSLLQRVIQRKKNLAIWAKEVNNTDVCTRVDYASQAWRACIHDLTYIDNNEARMILVNVCLEKLWKTAITQWKKQRDKNGEPDERKPLFIVLDEAHNFLSTSTDDPWRSAITDKVSRIVAEGRKYGLFLILSTQRPSKVPNSILIECENVCLLRLNSIVERNKARDIWGISRESIDQAAYFKAPGDGLLFGRWVPSVYAMHAAPRRTMEGGGNLTDDCQKPMEGF